MMRTEDSALGIDKGDSNLVLDSARCRFPPLPLFALAFVVVSVSISGAEVDEVEDLESESERLRFFAESTGRRAG